MNILPLLLSFTIVLLPGLALSQVVDSCGGEGVQNGVLAGDLDCSGYSNGLIIAPGGSLDLAGFELIAGSVSGIGCAGDCTINGNGGTIRGGGKHGINAPTKAGHTVVRDLTISDNAMRGILCHKCELSGVTVSFNPVGVQSVSSVLLVTDSEFHDNEFAIVGGWPTKMKVSDSNIHDNSVGISSGRSLTVSNTTISGNTDRGIWAYSKATVTGSSVIGNVIGVSARRLRVAASTFSGSTGAYDIGTVFIPRLDDATSCALSAKVAEGTLDTLPGNWDVCSLD